MLERTLMGIDKTKIRDELPPGGEAWTILRLPISDTRSALVSIHMASDV